MNERAWQRLIAQIQDGLIVPVVGPQLLVDEQGRSLQARVARQLLELYGEAPPATGLTPYRELNDAVGHLAHLSQSETDIQPQEFYIDIANAIAEAAADGTPIPTPLQQLAEITDFRLLVTLTPDDMLARALGAHAAVREIIHSPRLPTSEWRDLPSDWLDRRGEAHLLYLFGKARKGPMFAIHDEDVLEYAHNIMAQGSHVPAGFLGELQARSLLILGCNFPDWLSRFFLRITNKTRLSEKAKREWLVETLAAETGLTAFLQCYSKETQVLADISPADFVAELHRRWVAERPSATSPDRFPAPADASMPREAMFFISYSRQTDAAQAEALFRALVALGVEPAEIWFDRLAIEPGDDFARAIFDGISGCRYFLPLASAGADARQEAFVLKEWKAATDRLDGINRTFIVPLVVDERYAPEAYTNKWVHRWAQVDKLDFGHAPQGVPDERLTKTLTRLIREAPSRRRQQVVA